MGRESFFFVVGLFLLGDEWGVGLFVGCGSWVFLFIVGLCVGCGSFLCIVCHGSFLFFVGLCTGRDFFLFIVCRGSFYLSWVFVCVVGHVFFIYCGSSYGSLVFFYLSWVVSLFMYSFNIYFCAECRARAGLYPDFRPILYSCPKNWRLSA